MTISSEPVFHTTADGEIDIDAIPIEWFIGAHRETAEATVKSVLNPVHEALGAHYVSLDDVQWVVRYGSIRDEYLTLKTAAGMLDISVMTLIELSGESAALAIQNYFSNDIIHAPDGSMRYGALVDDQGKVVDDCIVYKFSKQRLWLVANFHGLDSLPDCILTPWQAQRGMLHCKDISAATVKIQVQGPLSPQVMQAAFPEMGAENLASFGFVSDSATVIGRCGYSGEDGFEIFVPAKQGMELWNRLQQAGAVPYGIGAVEYCRVESGLLSLNDYTPGEYYPQEIGLGGFVKPTVAGHLYAYDTIRFATTKVSQWYVLFDPKRYSGELHWDEAPRNGATLQTASGHYGTITSLVYSPLFKRFAGLATFPAGAVTAGERVSFKDWDAKVTTLDEVRTEKKRLSAIFSSLTTETRK